MEPGTSLRNLTPSSADATSGSAATLGVADPGQIEHGHPGGGGVLAAVVKLQPAGGIVFPARSFAPDTLAVYVVEGESAAPGVSVAVCEAASYDTAAATLFPDPSRRPNEIVPLCTGSLNVTVGFTVVATPVVPLAGVSAVTVGAVLSLARAPNNTAAP